MEWFHLYFSCDNRDLELEPWMPNNSNSLMWHFGNPLGFTYMLVVILKTLNLKLECQVILIHWFTDILETLSVWVISQLTHWNDSWHVLHQTWTNASNCGRNKTATLKSQTQKWVVSQLKHQNDNVLYQTWTNALNCGRHKTATLKSQTQKLVVSCSSHSKMIMGMFYI